MHPHEAFRIGQEFETCDRLIKTAATAATMAVAAAAIRTD